jgi:hypothetical protein
MAGPTSNTRGILNPNAGAAHFKLDRVTPSADMAAIVDRYRLIRWDLRGAPPFAQETRRIPVSTSSSEHTAGRSRRRHTPIRR